MRNQASDEVRDGLVEGGTLSDKHIQLPGVQLWTVDSGGNGTPVVLLRANTGTGGAWEPQFQAFSDAAYRVIAFDRRGWGRSVVTPATGEQPGCIASDLTRWWTPCASTISSSWASQVEVSRRSTTRRGGLSD